MFRVYTHILGLPLALSSSTSFQDDLAQLLCARHLVLARSSLNVMLLDSPNLRDVYTFQTTCGPPVECADLARRSNSSGSFAMTSTSAHRTWCLAPRSSAGAYSVGTKWVNSEMQRQEMLSYAMGGGMLPPVQVSGPPVPCASSGKR